MSCLLLALVVAASACTSSSGKEQMASHAPSTTTSLAVSPLRKLPLPPPVRVRQTPDAKLPDPAFDPAPGARVDFGKLGAAAYRIEIPRHWNGRLVLFMHGFDEFAPETGLSAPDFRRYLIGQGYAWGASSFSSTSFIPGRAADETAALWDYFARKHGRPTWSYVNGFSMGGLGTHIAAERYANRFDGALGLCGAAGGTPGLTTVADFFVAAAYVAGVTQAEYAASTDIARLIQRRILPALRDPRPHARFEDIMIDLTGGPRAFAREGIHLEEETNWRRAGLAASAHLLPERDRPYQLGPTSHVSSADFNRKAIRLRTNHAALRTFVKGNDLTGRLRMPLLTLYSTGDGQVPMNQAQMLRQLVRSAGKADLLVQRVIRDTSHCGFTTGEQEAGLEALVRWVEHGKRPQRTDLANRNLTRLDRTFELMPRSGTPEADRVVGARMRVVVRGRATLDGRPFDARWLGANVLRRGLLAACGLELPPVDAGLYKTTVLADAESSGCGGAGAEILLWTFAGGQRLFSTTSLRWPGNRMTTFVARFSTSAPQGATPTTTEVTGDIYRRNGRRLPPGTLVAAYVGRTRCGVASTKRTGNYSGFILDVVGPKLRAGCRSGARLTFRINGHRAIETAINQLGHSESLDLTLR